MSYSKKQKQHGIRFPEEFRDLCTEENQKLNKALGRTVCHCTELPNWNGAGTFILHIIPKNADELEQNKDKFDEFWDALRKKGYLGGEPKGDIVNTVQGVIETYSCLVCNMIYF